MAHMFKEVEDLVNVNMTSDKNCEILSMEGAFENCRSLSEITVPASVMEIGNDAFNNTYNKTIIIHTVKGSAADKFAEKNGLSVVYD